MALMLDVRSLGTVEPICSVNTPREVTLHFLRTAGHPLTRWALQHQPPSPKQLEEEFLVRTWGLLSVTLTFSIRGSHQIPFHPGHQGLDSSLGPLRKRVLRFMRKGLPLLLSTPPRPTYPYQEGMARVHSTRKGEKGRKGG